MPRIDVCIEAFLENLPLSERAKRTYDAGFDAIEFWFYDMDDKHDVPRLAEFCRSKNVLINNIVANSPDGGVGGSLVNPADRSKYLARVKDTIRVAKDIGCDKMITCTGNWIPDVPASYHRKSMMDSLRAASDLVGAEGMTMLVEVLNSKVDHAGYFLDNLDEGAAICREVNSPAMKVLFDVYHIQIMQGNIIARIEKHLDVIGHFHSAGVPGRHELDDGELNYPKILRKLDELGYKGCFGLEYWPKLPVDESLRRMRELTRV